MFGAVQTRHAFDCDCRRADAGDADPHVLQEFAELDDVRLERGVAYLRRSSRGRGREKGRFGAGYGRLVQVHRGALQSVRRLEHVVGALTLPGSHRLERLEVRGDRPAGWKIASWRRYMRAPQPGEQRSKQQHGPA